MPKIMHMGKCSHNAWQITIEGRSLKGDSRRYWTIVMSEDDWQIHGPHDVLPIYSGYLPEGFMRLHFLLDMGTTPERAIERIGNIWKQIWRGE